MRRARVERSESVPGYARKLDGGRSDTDSGSVIVNRDAAHARSRRRRRWWRQGTLSGPDRVRASSFARNARLLKKKTYLIMTIIKVSVKILLDYRSSDRLDITSEKPKMSAVRLNRSASTEKNNARLL